MPTANRRAYEKIRAGIFSGRYPPGQQLKEEELALAFGVSRTPVRQAIRRLADEGLAVIRPNKRAYVTEIDEAQFEQVFDLLSFLESYSAGLAALNMPPEDIELLKELNNQMDRVIASDPGANDQFLNLNAKFHHTIHRASGNDKLLEMLEKVIHYPHNLYLKFGQINADHNPRSIVEHRDVIEAIEKRDRDYAALLMRAHTEAVRRAFRDLWSRDKEQQALSEPEADEQPQP